MCDQMITGFTRSGAAPGAPGAGGVIRAAERPRGVTARQSDRVAR